MKQELTFKSQARIIRTLGDKLISGEVAAVIELVKNAYDADANTCIIKINPNKDCLIISDDGHGMSLKDVQTKWTELGTDNKRRNNMSQSGKRRVLGNKGIGRLAASKLGRYLKINSTVEEDMCFKSILVEGLDWDAFSEKEDTYIEDIKFYAEEIEADNKSGTTLFIYKLTQDWTKEKLESLVLELRKLMSPISQDDNDFNIYLNLDAFTVDEYGIDGSKIVNGMQMSFAKLSERQDHKKNKIVSFPILDACDYTFEAEYSKNKLSGTLKINDTKIEKHIEVKIDDAVNLGEGLVQLNIFDRDADSLKNTFIKAGAISDEDKKKFPLREARHYLDDLSGIDIYRNEFRIRPYGDKNSDWLGLNKRRVQNPSKCLEQAQISGLILVEDEDESGLIECSSREGFEYNDNYMSLTKLLLKALGKIEVLRFSHRARTGKNRKQPNATIKSAFSSLYEKTNLKKIESFSSELPKEKQEEFRSVVSEYETSLDKLVDIIKERQAILEARSTIGFLFAEVLHEIRHLTSAVGSNLLSLSKRVENKWQEDISLKVAKALFNDLAQDLEHIKSLEDLLKRLDPLINIRRKKTNDFSVYEAVKKALLLFGERAAKHRVVISHKKPEDDCKMHGLEVDIYTTFINLIDNALYWHEQRKTESPVINISYENKDDCTYIFVEDNAGGISEQYQDSIFDVGFTTKEEGSGLGLSIAREALGRSGAYIQHKNISSDSSRLTIEVRKDL